MALPTKQEDVDALWSQARAELRVPAEEKKEKRSPETKRNDGESASCIPVSISLSPLAAYIPSAVFEASLNGYR